MMGSKGDRTLPSLLCLSTCSEHCRRGLRLKIGDLGREAENRSLLGGNRFPYLLSFSWL